MRALREGVCGEHFAGHPTKPHFVAVCTRWIGHDGDHDNLLPPTHDLIFDGPDFEPGQGVVYRPYEGAQAEDGTVVRWNDSRTLVFVLFVGDRTAKAVSPSMLRSLS